MELASGTEDTLANPTIVVEVLSKSTEAYDRGLKWEGYRGILSLADYLLVSQSKVQIEHFQRERSGNGEWHYRVVEAGGRVVLSNGAAFDVDAVYRGAFDFKGE
jgi:Uma2 family endonuclease